MAGRKPLTRRVRTAVAGPCLWASRWLLRLAGEDGLELLVAETAAAKVGTPGDLLDVAALLARKDRRDEAVVWLEVLRSKHPVWWRLLAPGWARRMLAASSQGSWTSSPRGSGKPPRREGTS